MFQNQNIHKPARRLFRVCMALLALSLCACSFFRPSLPGREEQSEKLAEAMAKGGYAPARGFEIGSKHDIWMHDGTELDVLMTAPTAPGSYPLIVYLPSLGEDARAGQLWRETWAKAGYAVFSMQPLAISRALKELGSTMGVEPGESDEGESFGSSDEDSARPSEEESGGWFGEKRRRPSRAARNSELRYLGHEFFATDRLKNRMEQLFWAYRQAKIWSELRQPLFASADFSKVILAGYDLGAQTVTAVMGENFETPMPVNSELKPLAAMVLSPSVNLATGNVRSRFQKLSLPILVITGTEDNDPYAISSSSVRTAVWGYAPGGGKYLLLLKGGGHRLLSGSEMGGRFARNDRGEFGGMLSGGMGSGRAGGGRGMEGMSGGFPDGMREGFPIEGGRKDPNLGYKHVAAIYSASTAFLDSVVKNDRFARFWLEDKVNPWLGGAGALNVR
ncbi:MAG: hypothetical protein LUQ11_16425 [Methylococcaceae bacterium]|nr:hypothetical protein [Methylococcaceae bacterium]